MTKEELEVTQAIFETIRLHENWAFKSSIVWRVTVDEVTVSDEQLRRAASEVQNAPTLVTVEARVAFVNIDQNCDPAPATVTETKQDYDIALHRLGPELCGHFTVDEVRRCELKALEKEALRIGCEDHATPNNHFTCPICGWSAEDLPF